MVNGHKAWNKPVCVWPCSGILVAMDTGGYNLQVVTICLGMMVGVNLVLNFLLQIPASANPPQGVICWEPPGLYFTSG